MVTGCMHIDIQSTFQVSQRLNIPVHYTSIKNWDTILYYLSLFIGFSQHTKDTILLVVTFHWFFTTHYFNHLSLDQWKLFIESFIYFSLISKAMKTFIAHWIYLEILFQWVFISCYLFLVCFKGGFIDKTSSSVCIKTIRIN